MPLCTPPDGVAHGSHAAGSEEAALPHGKMVCRPDLILSHIGAENTVGLHPAGQRAHEGFGLHVSFHGGDGLCGVPLPPVDDGPDPFVRRLYALCPAGELGEHLTEIADDGDMYREIFADLRGIDIDMDDLGPGGNLAGRGHRAVPYPGPRHDDEIGVPHGFVGRGAAVGPEHAEI